MSRRWPPRCAWRCTRPTITAWIRAACRRRCAARASKPGSTCANALPALAVELDASQTRVVGVRFAREKASPMDVKDAGAHRGDFFGDGWACEVVHAREVVVAMGAWSGELAGLPDGAGVAVRPVKGQIMRLHDPAGPGLLEGVVRFEGGYLVPRGDGRYVLGATMEERGFEPGVTAGGMYELLRDAHELVPGVSELHIDELGVGYRPGHARQHTGDRARRARRFDVGDRSSPQRHPAGAADRRAGGGVRSLRRRLGEPVRARPRPPPAQLAIYLNGNPHDDGAEQTVAGVLLALLISPPMRAGWRWRSMARWCRGQAGARLRSPTARMWRS